MACIIYREGKGTVEFGIECESATCEVEHLEGLLNAGWSQNPPGHEPVKPEAASVAGDSKDDDLSSPDDVRAAAKAAGIEGWDTKRIATLRAALEE